MRFGNDNSRYYMRFDIFNNGYYMRFEIYPGSVGFSLE